MEKSLLNPWGLLSFPASSIRDEGVRETLKSILGLTVNHLTHNSQTSPQPTPAQLSEKPVVEISTSGDPLGLEYGPPLPGSEIPQDTKDRGQAIFDQLSSSVVVPVQIPRGLLEKDGPLRVLLEIEIID